MKLVYQSDDGSIFNTEEECKEHDREVLDRQNKKQIYDFLQSTDFVHETQNIHCFKLELFYPSEKTLYIIIHAKSGWKMFAETIVQNLFGIRTYFKDNIVTGDNLLYAWHLQNYSGKYNLMDHQDSEHIIFEANDVPHIFSGRIVEMMNTWHLSVYTPNGFILQEQLDNINIINEAIQEHRANGAENSDSEQNIQHRHNKYAGPDNELFDDDDDDKSDMYIACEIDDFFHFIRELLKGNPNS